MTSAELTPPSGALGRADLLRVLALAPRDRLTLDHDGETWFGYVRQPEQQAEGALRKVYGSLDQSWKIDLVDPGYRLPLKMPFVHAIVSRELRQPREEDETLRQALEQARPITEEDAKAPSEKRLVQYQDLVPQARLLPALRRQLTATRAGSLDVESLVRRLATGELPRHLPRRPLQRWHPELVVLLDFAPRLWPYREDLHHLAERLLRHCGRSGVSLRILNHGPFGTWSDWAAHQNPAVIREPPEHVWTLPPAGTPVLIAGDLGLLLGPGSDAALVWRRFIEALIKAQLKPLALVPLGATQLDQSLPSALTLLRWSPDARPRPERPKGQAQTQPEGLDDLLAMAAVTRRVDPPLLRALRRLNGQAPLNAGLEGAFWCHGDVDAGFSAAIRPDAQEPHLSRFARLHEAAQAGVEKLRCRHHAHLRAALNHEEVLLWASHAGTAAKTPEAAERVAQAEAFLPKLAATLRESQGKGSDGVWRQVATELVRRADGAFIENYRHLLTPLAASLIQSGGAVPDWLDPAELKPHLEEQGEVLCSLVRDAASQSLVLQRGEPSARQSVLGENIRLDGGGARLRIGEGDQVRTLRISLRDLPVHLVALNDRAFVAIETAAESLQVAPVERPMGAESWSCERNGLRVSSQPLAGFAATWVTEELYFTQGRAAGTGMELLSGAQSFSGEHFELFFQLQSQLPVWARLNIRAGHGTAIQDFRWIEPGTFLMGSPDDEPERDGDEGPRHRVTITNGFWLADTACTQALWRAVMGSNPSYFAGNEQRPVEQVTWYEVQAFLRKLEGLLPGCRADLPTEVEWEYACRAGTYTPFSFGVEITAEQVNYDGNYPYAGGEQGLFREQTVPVKSLPPNPWGLYEMHGNVWEWCADGLRDYTDETQRDPVGPVLEDETAQRAVRGGSWNVLARRSRSAFRNANLPGNSVLYLGFRFCLRFIGPGGLASSASTEPAIPPRDEGRAGRGKQKGRFSGKKKQ